MADQSENVIYYRVMRLTPLRRRGWGYLGKIAPLNWRFCKYLRVVESCEIIFASMIWSLEGTQLAKLNAFVNSFYASVISHKFWSIRNICFKLRVSPRTNIVVEEKSMTRLYLYKGAMWSIRENDLSVLSLRVGSGLWAVTVVAGIPYLMKV